MHKIEMLEYLKNKKQEIEIISSISTTVGVLLAFVGLIYAGIQIKDTNNSIQATRIYEIQRSGSKILEQFLKNDKVYEYVFSKRNGVTNIDPEVKKEFNKLAHVLIQFYSTVYNQKIFGYIPDRKWEIFRKEICGALERPAIKQYWSHFVLKGSYDEGFKRFPKEC